MKDWPCRKLNIIEAEPFERSFPLFIVLIWGVLFEFGNSRCAIHDSGIEIQQNQEELDHFTKQIVLFQIFPTIFGLSTVGSDYKSDKPSLLEMS